MVQPHRQQPEWCTSRLCIIPSALSTPAALGLLAQVLAELDPEADAELGLPDMVGQYHSIYPLEDVAQVRHLILVLLCLAYKPLPAYTKP